MTHLEALRSIQARGVIKIIRTCSSIGRRQPLTLATIQKTFDCGEFEAEQILSLITRSPNR